MNSATQGKIVSFIWGIADDILRDLYVRGKYRDVIENFEFRHQIPRLTKADALGALVEKFLDPTLDLSPDGLDSHGMGSIFEELVRRFNEENNEEAGEHWTPRDAVRLMTRLMFEPIADAYPQAPIFCMTGRWAPGECSR